MIETMYWGQPYISQSPVLCSNIHTSMSTLTHSTLFTLTKCADFQMSVSFQIEYSVVH